VLISSSGGWDEGMDPGGSAGRAAIGYMRDPGVIVDVAPGRIQLFVLASVAAMAALVALALSTLRARRWLASEDLPGATRLDKLLAADHPVLTALGSPATRGCLASREYTGVAFFLDSSSRQTRQSCPLARISTSGA
jgi:hypothetical protein